MLFIVSDAKEKLMILVFFILIAISFCIVKSDTMHDFILYLHDIGFVNSIYWFVLKCTSFVFFVIFYLYSPLGLPFLREKRCAASLSRSYKERSLPHCKEEMFCIHLCLFLSQKRNSTHPSP